MSQDLDIKIVGSGLGRTGTLSLKHALEILTGEPCFHMTELLKDTEDLKHIKQKNWAAFSKGYGSAVDYPICLFIEELLQINPELKVIHTRRDPLSWYESVEETIYRPTPKNGMDVLKIIWSAIRFPEFRRVAPVFRYNEQQIWKGQFKGKFHDKAFAIDVYQRHEAYIQSIVPKRNLLMYEVREGWKPLCDFLQLPKPKTEFPNTNAKADINQKIDRLFQKGELVF